MEKYKFNQCDCEFPCSKQGDDLIIEFDPNIDNIPLDCVATWDLISDGNTKGVFQLESRLGQMLAKRLKPRNIEHLAALVAIMRPGCLEAERDGKSVTQHYIDRKNGEEVVEYFHPSLEASLGTTYGEMIYQEQAMQIARDLAGFNLQEADILRKAIGKKKADIMSEVENTFMEGVRKQGIVNEEVGQQIFEWIRKSQRYSFNKSHSVSYAINAYLSAYAKAHFRREFFTSYLYYAKQRIKPHEEIKELSNNAKSMEIDILPPDLRKRNAHFSLLGEDIYFGLTDIKGVGDSVMKRLSREIPEAESQVKRNLNEWSWSDFLLFLSPNVNKTAIEALIKAGALNWMGISRQKMWFEYEQFSALSQREQTWLREKYLEFELKDAPLSDLLGVILKAPVGRQGGISNKNRAKKVESLKQLVDSPPSSLDDTAEWIASVEESLMGIPITCTIVDACETTAANTTCADFNTGVTRKTGILMAVKVDAVKEIRTKRGRNPGQAMAFITVSDSSGVLDSVVMFPDEWREHGDKMFENNTVMLSGERGQEKDSFIIKRVWQI